MGKVSALPVTDKFRSSLSHGNTENPFMVAKAIKESTSRRMKLPSRRIFGDDMPTSVTTISPLGQKNFE